MMPEGLSFSLRVSLRRSEKFFGPGVASLLRLVERTGSLQTAAAEMQMSYSKAWKIIRKAEGELGFPLMERRVGGAGRRLLERDRRGKAVPRALRAVPPGGAGRGPEAVYRMF